MGQYFLCVNPDRDEYLHPHAMGCGLKKPEIVGSGMSVMDAFAMLIADPGAGGRRPGDVHVPGRTGRWAGQRCFFVGDYAEDGDLPQWGWPTSEGEMYDRIQATGRDVGRTVMRIIVDVHAHVRVTTRSTTTYLDGTVDVTHRPVDVPVIGAGEEMRIDERDRTPWNADGYDKARRKLATLDVERYVVDAADGTRRLVANLDRREYLDPRQLAEIPTMAGIMRGNLKRWNRKTNRMMEGEDCPTTLQLLGEMTFHDPGCDYEGGVDRMDLTGRWRGDRLVITSETSRTGPTTTSIEGDPTWTNVTGRLLSLLPKPDWKTYHDMTNSQRYGAIGP